MTIPSLKMGEKIVCHKVAQGIYVATDVYSEKRPNFFKLHPLLNKRNKRGQNETNTEIPK